MMENSRKIFRQSRQGNRMLELLRTTGIHPTADWLYEKLKKELLIREKDISIINGMYKSSKTVPIFQYSFNF